MNKKTFMTKKIFDINNINGRTLIRFVETDKAKWIQRYRLCRVFGLNPFEPIN